MAASSAHMQKEPEVQQAINERLIKVAFEGDLKAVKGLLDPSKSLSIRANVNAKSHGAQAPYYKGTALLLAAHNGDFPMVKCLLKHGASLTEVDEFGRNALLAAASSGYIPVVEYLLRSGAKLTAADNDGNTALLLAAMNGLIPMVEYLLCYGAKLAEVDNHGHTALLLAARNGLIPMVECLLRHGAKLVEVDNHGHTALLLAASSGYTPMVEWLLRRGASLKAVNKYGNTALLLAARNGLIPMMECLLQHSASLEERNKEGDTALILATLKGHTSMVAYLMAYQSAIDEFSQSPMLQQIFGSGNHNHYFLQTRDERLDESVKRQLHDDLRPTIGLAVIHLDGHLWTPTDWVKFRHTLSQSALSITRLSLVRCNLAAEDMATLAASVPHLPLLTRLDLSYNPAMGDAGFQSLCQWVRGMPLLTHVSLVATGLSHSALAELLKSLKEKPLQQLDVSHNRVYINALSFEKLVSGIQKTALKATAAGVNMFGNYLMRDTKAHLTQQTFFSRPPSKSGQAFNVESLLLPPDERHSINYGRSFVFLCRNTQGDAEHAMLIVEGLYGFGQRFMKMYDFRPTSFGSGKVSEPRDYDPVRFANMLAGYRYKAYPCTRITLKALMRNIETDRDKALFYEKSGVAGPSSGRVYNCFTWALDKLIEVGLEEPGAQPSFIAIPSLILRGQEVRHIELRI